MYELGIWGLTAAGQLVNTLLIKGRDNVLACMADSSGDLLNVISKVIKVSFVDKVTLKGFHDVAKFNLGDDGKMYIFRNPFEGSDEFLVGVLSLWLNDFDDVLVMAQRVVNTFQLNNLKNIYVCELGPSSFKKLISDFNFVPYMCITEMDHEIVKTISRDKEVYA